MNRTPSRRNPVRSLPAIGIAAVLLASVAGLPAEAAETGAVVREATGKTAVDVKAAFDQFRVDLGGGSTAGANGSFGGQRREINWDGVPDQFASPKDMPADFFNTTSPRGAVFSTPGIAFQLSAKASVGVPVRFGNLNPSYISDFGAFSAERIFAPIGSTVTIVDFFVPGSNTKAVVKGFGAVFTDVDSAESSTIEAFGTDGSVLFKHPVLATPGNASFSFTGVSLPGPARIARVRVTSGGLILSDGTPDSAFVSRDKVAIDDLIYGEPEAVPAPGSAPVTTAPTPATAAVTTPATSAAPTTAAKAAKTVKAKAKAKTTKKRTTTRKP